ncbi:MAG TPA: NAD(P)/FAD-dependent oxidoreductase [candidate division Zixibacteria bacterium]|nr:NAD(P)/FAD-dependent oxidoreductase [candidate division Zixibacteria bacterium]
MGSFDAIIIGAGSNGLVAAAYLAGAGRKVLVLERRHGVGGLLADEEICPGFRAPVGIHLCGSFSPRVAGELELGRHGFELLPLDPPLFAPLPDGDALTIPSDPARFAEEVARFSRADGAKIGDFIGHMKRLGAAFRLLTDGPMPARIPGGARELARLAKLCWKLQRLGRRRLQEFLRFLPLSVADFLNEWFETEIVKAALAAPALLGGSVGPRAQGTACALLHQLQGQPAGAFRSVRLATGGLAQGLLRAAQSRGAEVRTESPVDRILVSDGRATGVALRNGDEFHAAVVVSAVDVKQTFLRLVDPSHLDPDFLLDVRNIRSQGTVAKIHLALDGLPRFKGLGAADAAKRLSGVIHIGPALDFLERAADAAKYGRFSPEPFLEITIPSLSDPGLAPPAKHVMSIWMQYAPYRLREGGWERHREALGETALNLVEEYAPGFRDLILERQVLAPPDLEEKFGLTGGHVYHAELALDQIFFMRPLPGWSRYRTPLAGLYLCGAGTHPGGAVTGLSGCYAAREILKDLKGKSHLAMARPTKLLGRKAPVV